MVRRLDFIRIGPPASRLGPAQFRSEAHRMPHSRGMRKPPLTNYIGKSRRLDEFRGMISEAASVADYLRLDRGEEDPFANVDYIMRFENLVDDFRTVCGTLGISPATLPRYNRSGREHYSKYYDDELREFVSKRFALEIERFGYTFD